jgi:hypothetical protein
MKTARATALFLFLKHDPEKHALGLDPWVGFRFSGKIMLQLEVQPHWSQAQS